VLMSNRSWCLLFEKESTAECTQCMATLIGSSTPFFEILARAVTFIDYLAEVTR
jgi:hypothetical protein